MKISELLRLCADTNAPQWNIFGSPDSRDIDIMFNAKTFANLNLEGRKVTAKGIKHLYGIPYFDPNLCTTEQGEIKDVFKGTIDEVNNMLYFTYDLHEQHGNRKIIETAMPRNVLDKRKRVIRGILSYLSRTEERKTIKKVLGDYDKSREYFKTLDLKKFKELNKNNANYQDFCKFIAFQTAQLYYLDIEGIEIFTKQECFHHCPVLKPMLYYQEFNDSVFDQIKEMLSVCFENEYEWYIGRHCVVDFLPYYNIANSNITISNVHRCRENIENLHSSNVSNDNFFIELAKDHLYNKVGDSVYSIGNKIFEFKFDKVIHDFGFNDFSDLRSFCMRTQLYISDINNDNMMRDLRMKTGFEYTTFTPYWREQ